METPLISVIVPAYNIAPYLEKSIASICTQSYKNLENPDVNTYTFKDGVESLTFTNTGEQVCFVIEADYSAVATGITSANETVSAPINKVIENGRITILRNNTKYSVAGTVLK